jgi:hypothetical protein
MDRTKLLFRAWIGKVARILAVCIWVICLTVMPGRFDRVRAQSTMTFQPTQVQNNFPTGIHFEVQVSDPGVAIQSAQFVYEFASVIESPEDQQTAQSEAGAGALHLQYDWSGADYPLGIQLKFHWEVTFADGQKARSEPETYTFADTNFPWEAIQQDEFTLYCHDRESQFCQDLADSASADLTRIERMYGAKFPFRIQIWIYNDMKEIQKWYPEITDESLGVDYPNIGVVAAHIPLEDNGKTWMWANRLISEDISHLLFLAVTSDSLIQIPAWLEAGSAVYSEPNERQDFIDTVMQADTQNGLIPIAKLNACLQDEDQDVMMLAWGESYTIVSFIMDVYGDGGYRRLLSAYTDSLPGKDPFQIAFQLSEDDFEARWQRWLSDPAGVKAAAAQISLQNSPTPAGTQRESALSGTAVPSESTPTPAPTRPAQATATPTPQIIGVRISFSMRQAILYGLDVIAGLVFLAVLTAFLIVLFRMPRETTGRGAGEQKRGKA